MKVVRHGKLFLYLLAVCAMLCGVPTGASAQLGFGKDLNHYRQASDKSAEKTSNEAQDLYERLSKFGVNSGLFPTSEEKKLAKFYKDFSRIEKNAEELRTEFDTWIENSDKLFTYLNLLSEDIGPNHAKLKAQAESASKKQTGRQK